MSNTWKRMIYNIITNYRSSRWILPSKSGIILRLRQENLGAGNPADLDQELNLTTQNLTQGLNTAE